MEELSEGAEGKCYYAACDVSDDAAVAAFCGEAHQRTGTPDLLINNAGVINGNAKLWEVAADEFARLIDININGTMNMIRHVVPMMMRKGSGIIVNMSSGWGRSTSPEVAPYCASKWAIEGLTGALAQELPEGMAAIALNPGVIDTGMLRSCFGDEAGAYRDAAEWAATAAPFLLGLGCGDNGASLTAP